jgi:hypothetical protein
MSEKNLSRANKLIAATATIAIGAAALTGCEDTPKHSDAEVAALAPFAPKGPNKITISEKKGETVLGDKVENSIYVLHEGVRGRTTPFQINGSGGEKGNSAFVVKDGQALIVDRPVAVPGWIGFRLEGVSKTADVNDIKAVADQYFWVNVENVKRAEADGKSNLIDVVQHQSEATPASGYVPAYMNSDGSILAGEQHLAAAYANMVEEQNVLEVVDKLQSHGQ